VQEAEPVRFVLRREEGVLLGFVEFRETFDAGMCSRDGRLERGEPAAQESELFGEQPARGPVDEVHDTGFAGAGRVRRRDDAG